jgi:2-(1,2-epoxy-1,2-dihydrophenyl)acetyl-CoA isomerase
VADNASFIPGYLDLGASPDGGSSYFLTRSLGAARALSALLLNRPLPSKGPLNLGLAVDLASGGWLR